MKNHKITVFQSIMSISMKILLIKPDKFFFTKKDLIVFLKQNLMHCGMFFGINTTMINNWENKLNQIM